MSEDFPELDFEAFHRMMAESMQWATLSVSFEQIQKEASKTVKDMKSYSLESAMPLIAGSLTIPSLQVSCIRLEILSSLAVLNCRGRKKASIGTISRWYRQISETKCVLGEDPSEDVFVTLVHNKNGNYRMLEGVWENAGFYTQRFADLVDTLPDQKPFSNLKASFQALLRISEAICDRSMLERYQLGSDERVPQITAKSLPNKAVLAGRVTFTTRDFDKLGINPDDIVPFLTYQRDGEGILQQSPGDNRLELRPIVQIAPYKFVVSIPTAISISIRDLVIRFMSDLGLNAKFELALANAYSELLYNTPLLGGDFRAPIVWGSIDGVRHATVCEKIDEGFHLLFHLFMPPIEEHVDGGFKTIAEDDGSISKAVSKALNHGIEQLMKREANVKGGIALVSGCGWGKGYSTGAIEFDFEGWEFETVPISDLVRLSWLSDMSPLYFFRVLNGRHAAESAGLSLVNINGIVNLIAWARSNDGNIIPHHLFLDQEVDSEQQQVLNFPTNMLRNIRRESDAGRDCHRVMDHRGKLKLVQRIQTGEEVSSDGSHRLYGSLEEAGEGRLIAVLDVEPPIWISISAEGFKEREIVLRLWEMGRLWVPRIYNCLETHELVAVSALPVLLELVFEGNGGIDEKDHLPSAEQLHAMVQVSGGENEGHFEIVMKDGFLSGFRHPENYAERAVVSGLIGALLRHFELPMQAEKIQSLSNEVVKNDDARSFHAIRGHSFLQFVAEALPDHLVELNALDDAISKIGMGRVQGVPAAGGKLVGVESCTSVLNRVVDSLISRIREKLSGLDRQNTLLRIYENIEKAQFDEDHWRRTSAAIIGLHGDNPEGTLAYLSNSSRFSGAAVTCRIVAEMAICECPEGIGTQISNLELSSLMSLSSMIYQLGGASDAIYYNALPPELHVSPFGDILFKDDLGELVVQPMLSSVVTQRFKDMAPLQAKNYVEPEVVPNVQEFFDPDFLDIWMEEMGFHIDSGRAIIEGIEDFAIENKRAVFVLKSSQFKKIVKDKDVPLDEAEKFLVCFSLVTRERWDKAPKGYSIKEIYPWRFGRRLSLVTRPILQINNLPDPDLIVSPNSLRRGFSYLLAWTHKGRLEQDFYTSERMRNEWYGKASEGHTFVREVANKLEDAGWRVRIEIELQEVLRAKQEKDYGDVDVLAWSEETAEVLVVECKDLSLARNHTEVAHMLSEFQGRLDQDGEPDRLKRHLDRVERLLESKAVVAKFCGLEAVEIRSALICSGTVPMQYAQIEALQDTYVGGIETLLDQLSQQHLI